MKSLVPFLILYYTLTMSAGAQQKTDDFIVTNSGDTIRGVITPVTQQRNPDRIEFRKIVNGPATNYKPFEIREFRIGEEHFVSAAVQIEADVKTQNDPYSKSQWVKSQDTVFLQTIVGGSKSVYILITPEGSRFMYVLQNGTFELLSYRKTIITTQAGLLAISESKLYQGQLAAYLKECPNLESKIRKTTYEKRSMQLLFLEYYKCIGQTVKFARPASGGLIQWGIEGGVTSMSLSFTSVIPNLNNASFKVPVAPTAGLFLTIGAPGKLDRFSLHNELLYTSYTATSDKRRTTSPNSYDEYHSEIGQSFIKMNNLLRYRIPVSKLSVTLNAGLSTTLFQLSSKNTLSTNRVNNGSTQTLMPSEAAPGGFVKRGTWFMLGAGITFNKWSIEFRYENIPKIAASDNIETNSSAVYGLLSYRLSKR